MLAIGSGVLVLVVLAVTAAILFQQPWFQQWFFDIAMTRQTGQLAEPPAEPRVPYTGSELSATDLASPAELFRPTNIWTAHLSFTKTQWAEIQPKRVPRLKGWIQPNGAPRLLNPQAPRPGLAGVLGFSQPWSQGTLELGGVLVTNVAVRFKGNGTFVEALRSYQRPFKVNFEKQVEGRQFLGQTELNFHNLVADRSFLSDTLAYEFFRDAGVPAPRTAYVRLFLSLEDHWDRRLLGLYLLVEDPDANWLATVVGAPGGALFKPVTYELFHDLGSDWAAYEKIYDPKTPVTEAHRERLLQWSRLVTHADDEDFARQIGDFLDLDETARFLACNSLLANYDSIFDNGQNYLLWLDSRTHRFGFSPWDLDHSWGEFPWAGSADQRERVSLWHPWLGENRFLERLFKVEAFRDRYRGELQRQLDTLFIPDRLNRRIDELAANVRPAVAQQASDRVSSFEKAILPPPSETGDSARSGNHRRQGHQLKYFILKRSAEARAQLEGRSEGVVLRRGG